ncbi:unnamed protein product, partial [Durusdinium trenchii]
DHFGPNWCLLVSIHSPVAGRKTCTMTFPGKMLLFRPRALPLWQFATMWLPFHNGSLCLVSVVLFAGCLFESVCRLRKEGWGWLICEDPKAETAGPLYFWSYAFYVSKYVEFGDTFLLILKSGQRSKDFGLHLYHHALVPVITFFWLQYAMSLQFIGVLWNTLVHVMMYAYFAFKEAGFDMPFSFVVWCLQVVQFLCSFPCGAMVLREIWDSPFGDICAGQKTMWVSFGFNMSLLFLFGSIKRRRDKIDSGVVHSRLAAEEE